MNVNPRRPIFNRKPQTNIYRMFVWVVMLLGGVWMIQQINKGDIKPLFQPTAVPTRSATSYALEGDANFNAGKVDAAILAYRSTMSLPREYRNYIKQAEVDTNELLAVRLRACIAAGLFREVNVDLITYQLSLYAHTWSLKYWRLSELVDLDEYVAQGFDFFVHAMATPKGRLRYRRFLASRESSPPARRRAAAGRGR